MLTVPLTIPSPTPWFVIICDVDIQQAATEGLETTIDPWTPTDLYIDASRTILNA